MSGEPIHPYPALRRIFHEPSRLAIMTSLLGAPDGLSFTDLRKRCALTDGNLSRHLTTLEEAEAIRIQKGYAGRRPRTTVLLSIQGRQKFMEYLDALEKVLTMAARRIAAQERDSRSAAPLEGRLAET